jgi:UDP-glucuronate 4-epimerase
MKIFITGIAGFIGFHTALKLSRTGHFVVGMDNFNTYYDPSLKYARAEILEENNIICKTADLRHKNEIDALIFEYKPDLVIHLAAMAGVRHSMNNPKEYIDNNIIGSMNLIEVCETYNVENVIYASTSCVMHGCELPWGEHDTFKLQINPYGYTKLINESQFHISNISNAVGLRFFTVYGPYGRPDMALFDFTKNIIAGNEITLFNYGDMKRDFTYVDDIVQAIELVANNMTNRDMYCVGYGEQIQLERFVDAIEFSLGTTVKRKYGPKHPADAKETWSDTTKLQKLGYSPNTSIEIGVDNFVKWYRKFYKV